MTSVSPFKPLLPPQAHEELCVFLSQLGCHAVRKSSRISTHSEPCFLPDEAYPGTCHVQVLSCWGHLGLNRFSGSPSSWVVAVSSTLSLHKSVFQVCLHQCFFSPDSHLPDLGPWGTPPQEAFLGFPMPLLPIESRGSPHLICSQSILGYSHCNEC